MTSPNFIYVKRNVLSSELCEKFISTFNKSDDKRQGLTMNDDPHEAQESSKKSTDITFNPSFKNHPQWGELLKTMIHLLKQQIKQYQKEYFYIEEENTLLANPENLVIFPYFNMQHYKPREGFYKWHCERSCSKTSQRILTWMFFLNNVTDGGTRFYYQNHTESAEQGKIVIFSSDYIHAHKGEISKTKDKYILTGWVNLKK